MSGHFVETIYQYTKNFKDPVSNEILDKNCKNFFVTCNNGNANISIEIEPQNIDKYEELSLELKKEIKKIAGIKSINVTFTSNIKKKMKISEKKFSINSKNIIAIASGKGGVGKSTFSVNFAVALNQIGYKVGILDADIYGPSVPRMMNISGKPQYNEKNKLVPLIGYNIKCMSIGFLIDVNTPAIWRGPMIMKALEQMYNGVDWGELDYLIIDLPPGTGDAQLTLAQNSKLTGSIIISTPQDVALIDAIKGINMFKKVNVPILGIIENMSYFICGSCNTKHEIFSSGGVEKQANNSNINFLGRLPLNINHRIQSDEGVPACISDSKGEIANIYLEVAKKINKILN